MEKEEVTNRPQPQQVRFAIKVQNKYCLTDDDDDEEDEASKCNDCISWPVVGKGGEGGKGSKGNKFKKFDFTSAIGEVKFIGAVEDERAGGAAMGLNFQVTDVRKPLLAVKRITEKGNVVQFGPAESDDNIKNKLSGKKILIRKKGGPT